MIVKLLTEHHLELLSLKLAIACHGPFYLFGHCIDFCDCVLQEHTLADVPGPTCTRFARKL